MKESFDSGLTLPSGDVSLDKVMSGFCRFVLAVPIAPATTRSSLFNDSAQGLGLASASQGVIVDIT